MKSFKCIMAALLPLLLCLPVGAQKYEGVIDKVVAVVGNDVITLSELESEVVMSRMQTGLSSASARCEVLEGMMQSKLFLTQARLDSLSVNHDMVEAQISERMTRVRSMFGGDDKLAEEYFRKPIYQLRQEWLRQMEEMSLIQQEQQEIMKAAPEVTPYDVNAYIDTADTYNLPMVPVQYRMSQICLYPDREAAAMASRETLLSLRERILAGERFSTLARLYSDDTESAKRGGDLGMADGSLFWPAFTDAAMALKPGMISNIVETPNGLHIIEVLKKDGTMFQARHILLKPKYTSEDRDKAFRRLDSLRTAIIDSTITFELAAKIYSQDPATRTNGGQMSDPTTGSASWSKEKIKPQDFNAVQRLEPGQISEPFESVDNEYGNTIYKIVRLDRILPAHVATVEHDFAELQEKVGEAKRREALDKFVSEKILKTYIRIDPLFRDCNFDNKGWLSRASEN